jgi:hypothetical protein
LQPAASIVISKDLGLAIKGILLSSFRVPAKIGLNGMKVEEKQNDR